ncbi:CRISPR-associated protein, Cas5d-type [Syntrophomonas zehnderi OL-4]|uniref:pre-crRNA processing endonuclease n=1 Tax=Syntrophomonas zehnderi OL-4 TaxID=690567 RepID=A0A0E4C8Y8_9FIRM|nr:type I-C CRISPR-associated protein Cas5c [Syntrophomonas zehnderi]CFX74495.1 CRISPR-associated protein, Cas5d-type [Syntrophomonas zehnderi OL-4]
MHNWCLEVWGEYACFTRPEMKVERVSYDVMTPSAARAIFEAILWKPAIRWNVVKIEVLNPIKWISVRRNEVGKTVPAPTAKQMAGVLGAPMGIFIEDERQQRAGLFLRDVRYRIHGYFDFIPPEQRKANRSALPELWADEQEQAGIFKMDETEAKYAAMFERRAKKGQCFHRPYLGCREFACDFRLVDPLKEPVESINETRDLGYMLYDMDFEQDINNPPPLFFRAQMENGVINTDRREVEVRG